MKPLSACHLYTFVDTAYLRGRAPEMVAQQLCDGGSDLIQLRAKQSSVAEVRALAEKILPITSRAGICLIINDHLSLAFDLARSPESAGVSPTTALSTVNHPISTAVGCHLGQEDFFDAGHTHVSELKAEMPSTSDHQPSTIIGLSTHSPAQAARAIAAEPDYIAIGPVYSTGTKPSAKPVTAEYVRWAAQNVIAPWFAIGGINLHTLDEVLAAGARRICVVSAILNTDNIAAECKKFKDRLA